MKNVVHFVHYQYNYVDFVINWFFYYFSTRRFFFMNSNGSGIRLYELVQRCIHTNTGYFWSLRGSSTIIAKKEVNEVSTSFEVTALKIWKWTLKKIYKSTFSFSITFSTKKHKTAKFASHKKNLLKFQKKTTINRIKILFAQFTEKVIYIYQTCVS